MGGRGTQTKQPLEIGCGRHTEGTTTGDRRDAEVSKAGRIPVDEYLHGKSVSAQKPTMRQEDCVEGTSGQAILSPDPTPLSIKQRSHTTEHQAEPQRTQEHSSTPSPISIPPEQSPQLPTIFSQITKNSNKASSELSSLTTGGCGHCQEPRS